MKLKPKNLSNIIIATLATLLTLLIYFSLITKNCTLEYPTTINPSEEFCLQGYYLLPNHYTINSTLPIKKEVKDKITILERYDLFAQTICLKPTTLLPENKEYTLNLSYINQLNLPIFQKQIKITTKEYPQVKGIHFEQKINYDHILKYETNYSSNLLNYHILYNENSVPCNQEEDYILCDISDLNLEQGNTYKLQLIAKYDDEIVNELDSKEVEILISVKIENSSIENKAVIQTPSIPEIRVELNKEVEKDFLITLEDTDKNPIPFEHLLEEKEIVISPTEEFKQSTTYYLKINNLVGLDSSHMDNEYTLEFSIDDGPTITGTNISSAFSISNNIVLTFNQNIKEPQDIKNIIKLNSSTNYTYYISKNKITINPSSNLNRCTNYSLSINKGIVGTTTLTSTKSNSYTIKTSCKRTVYVGTSVQGRTIYAYYFGSGSKKIIFYAAMHGSEANTKSTLNRWITELETYNSRIPTDKTIIVVPSLNPDGVAHGTRFNTNGVDLNRNFDTTSWVSGTYFANTYYPNGGGAYPFSEPESVAIRNLINKESPYLTLSYHSAASYVIPSGTSKSIELAHTYCQLSGYAYVSYNASGAFTYDITGDFGEWSREHGYNGLTIELASAYSDEFSRNRTAMWKMVEE
ncbi:DUF2817 domain-containing protein [bacterium]|nr:DUF2817 domain-containing protein [bacterium]